MTYMAVGGETGVRKLVDAFYEIMANDARYALIFSWHPDQAASRDKLTRFLCGWMGGPKLYQEKYGPISIPDVHKHLPINESARDQWLSCMAEALARQDYPASLVDYLFQQLAIPAEMIRRRCERGG